MAASERATRDDEPLPASDLLAAAGASRADQAPLAGGRLTLSWRPYRFVLPRALVTNHGALAERHGCLLRLEAPDGRLGWGEAPLLEPQQAPMPLTEASRFPPPAAAQRCQAAIAALGERRSLRELEAALPELPLPLGFALGAALAELEGLVGGPAGGWRSAPSAAWLLPAGEAALPALEEALAAAALLASAPPAPEGPLQTRSRRAGSGGSTPAPPLPFTVKWKVAATGDGLERQLLEELLRRLPAGARLRLDANGGWDRSTAAAWADRLRGEPRLEWLEQPLPPGDPEGLRALAELVPVALDESLRADPCLAATWPGWLVRRPALEGDPRPLLRALQAGRPRWMVSTALETGIGRRWLDHLAALQAEGPTPAAAGLAPGWTPSGALFSIDPAEVWEAAV